MCGLCGVLASNRHAEADRDLDAMTRALAHRGPDDRGTWQQTLQGRGGQEWHVGLGHTRLSIIDLSQAGHQPMLADDGVALVYNGEIYNHLALRKELEAGGQVFRSECDSEVVLHAYRAWGLSAFERFVGMFALAIWDPREPRLVLARDRLGIKPLYYHERPGALMFASELGSLRARSDFEPEIRRSAVETYLRFGYLTGPEAIYEDTWRVPPGHTLVWERGETRVEAYWRITDHAERTPVPASFEAAVDELESLLGQAVEDRLISDVPLGAFLSGGIDSSAVVALMQQRASGRVRTFSIGFEQQGFDEAPHARQVASHLGTDHTEMYVGAEDARRVLQELPTLYDEPFSDPSAIPTVLLSRLTRRHVTVALSGDGGDELFGGYNRYAKLSTLLPLLAIPAGLRRLLPALAPRAPRSSLRNGLLKLSHASDDAELAESFLCAFDESLLSRACRRSGPRAESEFARAFRAAPGDSSLRRAMYAEASTYMTDDCLVKVDRASMSVALEVRVPVIDHRVAEFAFGLPERMLSHGGMSKAPLRALVHRHVPAELVERPKHGFSFPVQDLLGAELEDWTRRYLDPQRLADEGLLDPEAVADMVAGARARGRIESELWRLLCFERWFAVNHRGESAAS